MIYKETQKDLFSLPEDYILAHCISADWALGAGIARQFQFKFQTKTTLQHIYPLNGKPSHPGFVGQCIPTYRTFNLVTKDRYWQKPTYEALKTALIHMRDCAEINHVKYIGMPKIGCGLDGLNWDAVRDMILEIFKDTDIIILVCYL